jgi:tRNA(His) 5'-end guanylyltransferase
MESVAFEAGQRAREYFHDLTVPPGVWTVIRVDGRSFSRLTEKRFTKPFDPLFADHMVATAQALLNELGGRYAYTESDEISILLDPQADQFGRGVEKLVSVSAGIASAAFSLAAGIAGHFDSRIWIGTTVGDVVDYFSWRQADATRCALNGWCYWTLRHNGKSQRAATAAMHGAKTSDKNELLYSYGVNFTDLPRWQRRGIGLSYKEYSYRGVDRRTGAPHHVMRRRLIVNRELAKGAEYRMYVERLCEEAVAVGLPASDVRRQAG